MVTWDENDPLGMGHTVGSEIPRVHMYHLHHTALLGLPFIYEGVLRESAHYQLRKIDTFRIAKWGLVRSPLRFETLCLDVFVPLLIS